MKMGDIDCRYTMNHYIETVEELSRYLDIDALSLNRVIDSYPMRINPYFLDLAIRKGEALLHQIIPDTRELHDHVGLVDPLAEERDSPVDNLTHRYPDRVLFLVSEECAVFCRFCTRKRRIGRPGQITDSAIEQGFEYIRHCREIRDVLVSGGDPLMLSDERLDWILGCLHAIPHVKIIRIGTRIPSVLPGRITPKLISIFNKYSPLYINVHFNHPGEVTSQSRKACALLSDGGIPLGNQTVLLRGINDDPRILLRLFRSLLTMRVKPYYLHQGDLTLGTDHFRTSIDAGLSIMKHLRGRISGMAIPSYVVDLPGGGGKVPLLPEYIVDKNRDDVVCINYQGKRFKYPQPSPMRFDKIESN
ncbi:KamA family radical SAM protein [bacterium]